MTVPCLACAGRGHGIDVPSWHCQRCGGNGRLTDKGQRTEHGDNAPLLRDGGAPILQDGKILRARLERTEPYEYVYAFTSPQTARKWQRRFTLRLRDPSKRAGVFGFIRATWTRRSLPILT